jgi:hypothetical protein
LSAASSFWSDLFGACVSWELADGFCLFGTSTIGADLAFSVGFLCRPDLRGVPPVSAEDGGSESASSPEAAAEEGPAFPLRPERRVATIVKK